VTEPILGIDPGKEGALTLYWPSDGVILIEDMPTMGSGAQCCVNGAAIVDWLEPRRPTHAFLEKVTAMRGWGTGSTFRFGRSVGEIRGVLAGMRIPFEPVGPVVWQRHFGISKADKELSRQRAIELAPRHSSLFARKKDHGRAESYLIARYGAETMKRRG
jgi:hypothetical protein